MAKLVTNVGVFVGFLNPNHDGKLLLVRRTSPDSIIPGVSFRGNWELPGGAMEETDMMVYNEPVAVAFQKAKEKTGIDIWPANEPFLGPWHATSFKGPQGYDLGQAIACITEQEPTIGETTWVSPSELEGLAIDFISETDAKKQNLPEAKGLLSGKGKRMYLMAMAILAHHSPFPAYRVDGHSFLRIACTGKQTHQSQSRTSTRLGSFFYKKTPDSLLSRVRVYCDFFIWARITSTTQQPSV